MTPSAAINLAIEMGAEHHGVMAHDQPRVHKHAKQRHQIDQRR